jgi:glycosyltransferase involved in cell wall biosynthesis
MLSINLTIHNKDFLVRECLERIKRFTKGKYEIVGVIDGCTDRSEEILDTFINENPNISIRKIIADDVFETKANNIAAKNSGGDFIAIIQDDMLINEDGWDLRMLKPFNEFSDVFSVTSRCSHNWMINEASKHINMEKIPDGIWSDILIHLDHADRNNTPRDSFEIRDSSNRGPLLINHSDFEKLGYFDEIFAPLDMDDHDLHYRAKIELGKVTGLYWIDYISDINWGGTRENGIPKQWALDSNHKNQKMIYKRHLEYLIGGNIESRKLKSK